MSNTQTVKVEPMLNPNIKQDLFDFITEYYGDRCPDYYYDCIVCKIWDGFDLMFKPNIFLQENWEEIVNEISSN